MNADPCLQQLEKERALVKARLRALQEFTMLIQSYEGDLFSWIVNRELQGHYPGKELGVMIGFDGEVWFQDADE